MLRTSAVLGQHFAFAHGRSGVLQLSLLTQTDLDRLLGAHDRAEVQTILSDLPFTKLLDQSQRNPDHVIAALGAWVRTEVAAMVPEHKRAPFDILWWKGDAPLLAALLKERLGLTSDMSRRPTPSVTAHPSDAWARLVLESDPHALPAEETAFVQEMIASQASDPAEIDERVSVFRMEKSLRLAERSGSILLLRFVRHAIDVRNIRTALRLVAGSKDASQMLPGGTIDPKDLRGINGSIASLVRRSGFYALADRLEAPGITGSDIEQALSAIRAEDIELLWNHPLTIEPVFAFAAVALNQLSLLRAILIGKLSDLSPQEIKRLLPPFLSATRYSS